MIGSLFDSPWKILIVAVVLIVLFGSKKLPDAARSLGRSMRILKSEVSSLHEDDPEFPASDPDHPASHPSGSQATGYAIPPLSGRKLLRRGRRVPVCLVRRPTAKRSWWKRAWRWIECIMVPLINRQARINHAKVTIIAPSSELRSPNQPRKSHDHRAVERIAMPD